MIHYFRAAMLGAMADQGLMTALVEGGSGLLGSFFDRELVDRVLVSVAPKIIGGVDAPSPCQRLRSAPH